MAPCKHLILLALLLSLFFFTAPATAGSFGVMASVRDESAGKGHDTKFEPREGAAPPEKEEVGDLWEIDYTPPQNNAPIHN